MKAGRFFAVIILGWVMLSSISYGYSGWVAGKTGNALAFDGVNDYVEVPGYSGIGGASARTVILWVKTSVSGELVQWGSDTTGQLWLIRVQTTGTVMVAVAGGGVYSKAIVADGQWHHIAAVLDEGQTRSDQIRLYVDGQLDAVPTALCTINTAQTVNVHLGTWHLYSTGGNSGYFNGLMDEVCIYNRALDASEIDPESPISTDGLVAHWAMNETKDSIAHDSISSYDGVLKNMPCSTSGWKAGKTGNALAFDGVNDYVDVPEYYGIGGSSARTVSLWIKTLSTGIPQALVQWGSSAAGQLWYLRVEANGTVFMSAYAAGVKSSRIVTDNQWHHIAAVMDEGQTNPTQIRLYIDGQLDAVPIGSGTINTTGTVPVHLGVWYRPNTGNLLDYFAGMMDDVCIYSRALDASEIDPQATIPTEGLVAHWAMDETEGTIAHDSASSYDGILRYIANDYPGGSGTSDDPFQIANKDDLLRMAADSVIYDKCFILKADIDLGGQAFSKAVIAPYARIGTYYQGVPFTGTFDGNSHKISQFTINGECYVGLFGRIGSGALIRNLGIENFTYSGYDYIGGLTGYNSGGTILNNHVKGRILGRECAGGLVGYLKDGTISNCSFSGTYPQGFISGISAGGLVGFQYSGLIQNSYSISGVLYDTTLYYSGIVHIGGLVGMQRDGIIKNCYSKGSVQVSNVNGSVGGLVGEQYKGAIISSYSAAIVSSSSAYAGGLVGKGFSNQVIRSFWDTQTSGKTVSAGGTGRTTEQLKQAVNYIGWNGDESVWVLNEGNDYPHFAWENTPGNILANGTLQGILEGAGTAQDPYLIDDADGLNSIGLYPSEWGKCFSLTQDIDLSGITGTDFNRIGLNSVTPFSGTFLGNNHVISNFQYVTTGQDNAVGLFGYAGNATIENLGLENATISSKGNQLGSLAGVQDGGNITHCYSINCHVTGGYGSMHVGGLVGLGLNGCITDCHTSGVISGGDQLMWCGGLAGTAKGQISNCHSTCSITGGNCSHFIGGFIGEASGIITDCYSSGTVSVKWSSVSIGGFAGKSSAVITNSHCQGTILCDPLTVFTGGFAGLQDGGKIRDCYSSNSVGGAEYVGGFIGEQDAGSVINCYTASSIDTPDDAETVGGFASVGLGAIVNSFWDTQVSNISYSSGARGRTTASMKEASNYIAWNEPNQTMWTLDETNDYPRLAWENLTGTPLLAQFITDYITDGSGTPEDPYQITTAEQLNIIGLFPDQWNKVFRIQNDIDMSVIGEFEYNRIGLSSLPFTGTLEGQGYVINNFSYKSMGVESCVGIVGYLSRGGDIKDLGLENINIATAGVNIGSLCGKQDSGTISNCYSTGLIIGDYITGGLAGSQDADGVIRNCFSMISVIGNNLSGKLGGLIGQQDGGTVTDCFATGRIFGYGNLGGLVGYQRDTVSVIRNCYSTGIVAGTGVNTGGLVGFCRGSVNNSFWDTQASMKSTSAGGTGKTSAQMKSCSMFSDAGWDFDTANVDGNPQDWVMRQDNENYPRLAWKPVIPESTKKNGTPYNGGAGTTDDPFRINDIIDFAELTETPSDWNKSFCLTKDIDLSDYVFNQAFISPQTRRSLGQYGPFFGTPFTGIFDGKGHVIHNMAIVNALSGFAGLFGKTKNAQIKNLGINNSFIDSRINYYCGFVVGYMEGGSMTQCYSTGDIGSSIWYARYLGGLVGYNNSGLIDNCYSKCNVSCDSTDVGGLVGVNQGTISHSYSTGSVAGKDYSGGLVGYGPSGVVWGSFWDTQTSGRTTSAGGIGKMTNEIQRRATFTGQGWMAGINNNGLMFDGVDDYVEVPGYSGIVGSSARTVSLWIKTSASGSPQALVQWGSDAAGQLWYLRVEADGKVFVSAYAAGVMSSQIVTDNQWHHIAAVLDEGQTDPTQIRLYIDGQLDAVPTGSGIINTTQDVPVHLGVWYGPSTGSLSNYFKGLIDEVCIYGRALEASEIDPEGPISTEGLIAHWAMDENEGLVVHDSVSSYDGIMKNFGDGWDFTNETLNGTDDIWRMCADGVGYPRLNWESIDGDFACPDGVSTEDLDYFVGRWLLENCTADNNYCGGGDVDASGTVDLADFAVLAGHWLEGI